LLKLQYNQSLGIKSFYLILTLQDTKRQTNRGAYRGVAGTQQEDAYVYIKKKKKKKYNKTPNASENKSLRELGENQLQKH
jgi:hypothetical protein